MNEILSREEFEELEEDFRRAGLDGPPPPTHATIQALAEALNRVGFTVDGEVISIGEDTERFDAPLIGC